MSWLLGWFRGDGGESGTGCDVTWGGGASISIYLSIYLWMGVVLCWNARID